MKQFALKHELEETELSQRSAYFGTKNRAWGVGPKVLIQHGLKPSTCVRYIHDITILLYMLPYDICKVSNKDMKGM